MATQASAVLEKDETPKPGTTLTWAVSLVACGYCLWVGAMLFYSTHAFANLYSSLGADLPLSTRIIVAFYRVLYPIVFGGAAALVIVKQYFVREKWANISATFGTLLIADFASNLIVGALYRPMLDFMEKLNK